MNDMSSDKHFKWHAMSKSAILHTTRSHPNVQKFGECEAESTIPSILTQSKFMNIKLKSYIKTA